MPTIGLRAVIGHELHGSVSIIMRVPFKFDLKLILFGEEENHSTEGRKQDGDHIIAREEISLGEFTPENTPLFERKVVPFSLNLTKKFGPSFTFGYESSVLKVKHRIQAICILRDDGLFNAKKELTGNAYYDKYAQDKRGVTRLGDEQVLILVKDGEDNHSLPKTVNMFVPVRNGFFGRTRRSTQFGIMFDKQVYAFNEAVKMRIDCNNLESNHRVKQIKFKLFLEFRQFH
jgi:hypothetical protein